MSKVELDGAALRQVLTGPQSEPVRLVRQAQRKVINAAKLKSPVDTGQLRISHLATPINIQGGRITTEVEANQDYALPVHEGSRPHIIRPKRARALAWGKGADRVFARSVRHPGTKARPWLFNALQQEAPQLGFVVTREG